jgi:hypothetical protein
VGLKGAPYLLPNNYVRDPEVPRLSVLRAAHRNKAVDGFRSSRRAIPRGTARQGTRRQASIPGFGGSSFSIQPGRAAMTEKERRSEELWEFDEFFKRHKTFLWVLVIGGLFSVAGLLCVARMVLQFLTR